MLHLGFRVVLGSPSFIFPPNHDLTRDLEKDIVWGI